MKNQISVFEFGDEFNCTEFFDSSVSYGGVDVSRNGTHLGQIIGLLVPDIEDEEETEKFNNEVINWIIGNNFQPNKITNQMNNQFQGTKGGVEIFMGNFGTFCTINKDTATRIATIQVGEYHVKDIDEATANANVMTEALNIAGETGLTPRDILNHRNELIGACNELLELLRFHGYTSSTEISNAKEIINKNF